MSEPGSASVMAEEFVAARTRPEAPKTPAVSVVIPLYNKAGSIRATLASVFAQTMSDYEVVVIDDGSTDNSVSVVKEFTDPRLRLIQQANAGESGARNRGIAEAASDHVAFIDADDLWFPNFLQTVSAMRARFPGAGAYATAFVAVRDGTVMRFGYEGVRNCIEGELVEDYFRSCTLGGSLLWSSCVMIPKHVFDAVGGFPLGVRNGADLHMWARIALQFPIAWSPLECAVWNLDAENRIAGRLVMLDAPLAGILEDVVRQGRVKGQQAKWVLAYLARLRIHYATVSLEHKNRQQARRLLWLARRARGKRRDWTIAMLRTYAPDSLLRIRRSLLSRRRTVSLPRDAAR